jgi:DNA-binding transcriptional regulator LsrR (DeoR family)
MAENGTSTPRKKTSTPRRKKRMTSPVTRQRLGGEKKDSLLLELSKLYCDDRINLSAIASKLSISRPTAQRLFTEAKERGYIREFRPLFQPPINRTLAQELKIRFRLLEAFVVDAEGKYEDLRSALASQAVAYLMDVVFKDRSLEAIKLGIAGGVAAQNLVAKIPPETRKLEICPLTALETSPEEVGAVRLSLILADKCKIFPSFRFILHPEISDAGELWNQLDLLTKLKVYEQLQGDWRSLNVCIFNVNPFDSLSQGVRSLVDIGVFTQFKDKIKYVFNGDYLDSDFQSVINPQMSIPVSIVNELSRDTRRYLILLAGGRTHHQKLPREAAIYQVLSRRLANVLVTDEETAEKLLDQA